MKILHAGGAQGKLRVESAEISDLELRISNFSTVNRELPEPSPACGELPSGLSLLSIFLGVVSLSNHRVEDSRTVRDQRVDGKVFREDSWHDGEVALALRVCPGWGSWAHPKPWPGTAKPCRGSQGRIQRTSRG